MRDSTSSIATKSLVLSQRILREGAIDVLAALCGGPRDDVRRLAARALGALGWDGYIEVRDLSANEKGPGTISRACLLASVILTLSPVPLLLLFLITLINLSLITSPNLTFVAHRDQPGPDPRLGCLPTLESMGRKFLSPRRGKIEAEGENVPRPRAIPSHR